MHVKGTDKSHGEATVDWSAYFLDSFFTLKFSLIVPRAAAWNKGVPKPLGDISNK